MFGEGNGTPLQYSCLENSMDGGACWATVHGVAKSRTRLSDSTSLHFTSRGHFPVAPWAGWIVLPFHRAAGARSQRLSWNRAWGRGSPGARGEGGRRAGSAPGAGLSRAGRVGNRVVAGGGGGPGGAPGIPTGAGKTPGAWQGRGGAGRGAAPGGGGGGLPRRPLGGRRGGWERPLRALLGPQGSASSGRGGGVRTTGQGTGTAWSREPRSPASVGTTWRSQKGLALGLKALTAPPLC